MSRTCRTPWVAGLPPIVRRGPARRQPAPPGLATGSLPRPFEAGVRNPAEGKHVSAVKPRFGICSWSLQPVDVQDVVTKLDACGISAVQLALDPVRTGMMPVDELQARFRPRGIHLLSGMMAMADEDYSTLESIR